MIQFFRTSLVTAGIVFATLPGNALPSQPPLTNEVPAVSQLEDVAPSNWAFQALQSLSARYGCVTGYPDATYRGELAVTRYEFAAAVSTCLDRINAQLSESTLSITSDDLATLKRLQSDFATELAQLQTRVSTLETRTATLQAQSVSPIVQLRGEVIFALAGVGGSDRKVDSSNERLDNNLVFGSRVRLDFRTRFNRRNRLRVRLQARNVPELEDATGTQMANLGFDGDSNGEIELDRLEYETRIGDRASATVSLAGGGLGDYISTVNPLFSGSDDGSISLFGRENPIRRQGSVPGIGLSYEITRNILLELGYVARRSNELEFGITKSPYAAVAQVTVTPSDLARFSLTYIRSFNGLNTGTSSALAADPFDDDSEAIIANSFGAEVALQLSNKVTLGGRVGWIQAIAQDLDNNPQANLFTWGVLLSVRDFGGDGNLLGMIVGQPLRVTRNQYKDREADAALHLEAFYRWQLNDNIAITPGAFIVLNPENNASNDPIYVGTIRTMFSF